MTEHLLSLIVLSPLAGLLLVLLLPNVSKHLARPITILATGIQFLLCIWVYFGFKASATSFQFEENLKWISLQLGSLGHLSIDYHLGVDGINISMLLLTGLVMFIGAIASWPIKEKEKGYYSLYLLLSASVAGCFVALDFFLFYLFFEFMLLPMYFLIGIWGGPRREYASIKFFLYTLVGSVFILIIMIGLYISVIDPAATAVQLGLAQDAASISTEAIKKVQQMLSQGSLPSKDIVRTFSLVAMTDAANFIPGSLLHATSGIELWGWSIRLVAFAALFIGFAIKLPMVPLHTWLPDAHVEAPTAISVVLAGILLKIGGYGLMRIAYPIFPEAAVEAAWVIGLLGLISIIYGALNALAMHDLKKLIAYSSVSHMGFVLLGLAALTAEGVSGAIYQMFSHGIVSSMLFLLVGVIYDRTHDRMIENYRGLANQMPYYTAMVTIGFFASLGLPGLSGFIAEVLVMLGAFNSHSVNGLLPRWMAIVATLGIVLSAAYYLWALQRMFFGKFWTRGGSMWKETLKDLTRSEWLVLLPLAVLSLVYGLFPNLLLSYISPAVQAFVKTIGSHHVGL